MLSTVLTRWFVCLWWAGLSTSACTAGTAPGTPLVEVEFAESQGGPPASATGTVSVSQHTVELNPDREATVELTLVVFKTTKGDYLKKVSLRAADSAGGEVRARLPDGAEPVNVGSHDEFVAMFPVQVVWTKDNYFSEKSGVTLISLHADETVQRD